MTPNKKLLTVMLTTLFVLIVPAQSILGKWKTIDDETGKAKSIVEIYKKGEQYYGKIVKLLIKPESETCKKCRGDLKDKPLIGLDVIREMKPSDDEYEGGTITDPKTGKSYKCVLKLEDKDRLKVRGYIGFYFLGRTQIWLREN